jgi:HicB family
MVKARQKAPGLDLPLLDQGGPVDTQPEEKRERSFSGKLPFRTTEDNHRNIYLAAQNAGVSINAWMEDVLSKAAQAQLSNEPSDAPLQPIQHWIMENPQAIAGLVDDIKPLFKNQKMLTTFEFLNAFETLVSDWSKLKSHLKHPKTETAMQLAQAMVAVLKPYLKQPTTEGVFAFLNVLKQSDGGREALQRCIKNQDAEGTVKALLKVSYLLTDLEAAEEQGD